MQITRHVKALSVLAICSAAILAPAAASAQDMGEKAVKVRQGYMQLVLWHAGPLFGMAKGDVAYDAESAKTSAESLRALTNVSIGGLFPEGTSKSDLPGKTRALADIWADQGKFQEALQGFAAAVSAVADAADKGQPELAAAVGELGKACGTCHKPFRADEF